MKFSLSTAVLSTLAASQLTTAAMNSRGAKHNHAMRHAELQKAAQAKRDTAAAVTTPAANITLADLVSWGVPTLGKNRTSFDAANPGPWIGTDGQYTNQFFNNATHDVILVLWGPWASWVNAHQPEITTVIPANSSVTVSFKDGMTGGWAPVYSKFDIAKSNGQIPETWGEYTFANLYSTVDVSREVNMLGSNMTIVTPKCSSTMSKCVFVCADESLPTCWLEYKLKDCDHTQPGQSGANSGWDPVWNAPSGGCSGIDSGAKLQTYFGYTS